MKESHKKVPLIIPVESQWREFDAKLLLACIAAARGYPVLIGPNREIESRIASFPKGIYFAYRMKSGNAKFFRILAKLGHQVVAWDEEALVHLPPEMYYSRRLSPDAFQLVSHLFAWGKDNVDLWRRYRHLPAPGLLIFGLV
jgi:surface carbohydrate biosynthesis protein